MAIEQMVVMNVVGLKDSVDNVAREIVLMENVDIINALNEINESHFTLTIEEENVEEIVDMSLIKPMSDDVSYEDTFKKIDDLSNVYEENFKVNKSYLDESFDYKLCSDNVDSLYDKLIAPYEKIMELKEEKKKIEEFYRNFMYIKDLDVEVETFKNLNYFTYTFGILSKENVKKLKRNYENITAIVLHTGTSKSGEVYLVISPKEMELETNRILRSLNFNKIEMKMNFTGTPMEIVKKLESRNQEIDEKLSELNNKFNQLKSQCKALVEECYSKLALQSKIKEVKNQMVSSNNFFYLSGWIPKKNEKEIMERLDQFGNLIIVFKGEEEFEEGFSPPTKLRNNKLFSPFEYLVKMYGIPSYNEIDPTVFLSITYMFLFGAMFGDVGQGLILFIGGLLSRTKSELFGNILSRLGISSMVFGLLYGSVFGFEHIINPVLISPSFEDFDSINIILISAVVIGVVLLLISYVYSIINAIKRKDLKEGLFGRNGVVGLVFYILLLILVGGKVNNAEIIPTIVIVSVLIVLIGLMVVREPLSNLILGKKPLYHETISSYYIESGFDILETLLNMLSSTVSFIRVGAFTLTHVGLFVAFEIIAHLLGSFTGSLITYIIANIIVIGLEGLIVFIQGLRLEYYELFSKYYKGEGVEFSPIKLND
ncbi:MAG: V-type ATP synthase subunit I [Firmicutes bacterium]|nr:V-type ATP synthase subunit I [Bacillota bacterium]